MKRPHFLTIEPTSECNARCPQCPRTFDTTLKTDPNLVIDEWSAEEMNNFLNTDWAGGVVAGHINGNYGDIVMHTHPKEFLQNFIDRHIKILISTNGAALHTSFWSWLGKQSNIEVEFAIEGVDQKSHEMYRRKTRLDVVLKNAKAYIAAGGRAIWMMTLFKHNYNQVDEARKLADEYGFAKFETRYSERFIFRDLIISDGDYTLAPAPGLPIGIDEHDSLDNWYHDTSPAPKNMNEWEPLMVRKEGKLSCSVVNKDNNLHNAYLSADKKLWPCCFIANDVDNGYKVGKMNDWIRRFYIGRGYDKNFNSLLHHKPEDILNSGFMEEVTSWNMDVCYQNCVGCD